MVLESCRRPDLAVLVGIDLRTKGHGWLVRRAADYALARGSAVDLVYVAGSSVSDADRTAHEAALRALLGDVPEAARGRGRVETMDPVEGLLSLTGEYELLVLGSREPTTFERLMRGPMATRVLRSARCAVLVPRGEEGPGDAPRMLVGVDLGGPSPERLIEMSAPWVTAFGGTLHALYVDGAGMPRIADRSVREAAEREWRKSRAPMVESLRGLLSGLPEANRGEPVLESGNPEAVLSQLSADYDVVLVGNRDRHGLSRLLLGAVADLVVRRACSDVISLPTNLES